MQWVSSEKINLDLVPRIILIVERFSDDLRKQATLIEPDVDLFEYTVSITPEGHKGITYKQVDLPKVPEVPVIHTIEDHLKRIEDERLQTHLKERIDEIKKFKEGIEVYATQSYIGLKYLGRNIAWINTRKNYYKLNTNEYNDAGRRIIEYPSIRIVSGDEDIKNVYEKIKILIDSIENR